MVAVQGNMDKGEWANELQEIEYIEIEGKQICVIHDIDRLDLEPAQAGIDVVVYGHSHRPAIDRQDGVLYLNPGSAGPRRFDLPISMALLWIDSDTIHAELVDL